MSTRSLGSRDGTAFHQRNGPAGIQPAGPFCIVPTANRRECGANTAVSARKPPKWEQTSTVRLGLCSFYFLPPLQGEGRGGVGMGLGSGLCPPKQPHPPPNLPLEGGGTL